MFYLLYHICVLFCVILLSFPLTYTLVKEVDWTVDKEFILKPKEDTTTTFSIRVDKALLRKYDELSNISGYSRNELINIAMREYVDAVKFVPNTENEEDVQKE